MCGSGTQFRLPTWVSGMPLCDASPATFQCLHQQKAADVVPNGLNIQDHARLTPRASSQFPTWMSETWTLFHCFPCHNGRGLNWKWSKWDMNQWARNAGFADIRLTHYATIPLLWGAFTTVGNFLNLYVFFFFYPFCRLAKPECKCTEDWEYFKSSCWLSYELFEKCQIKMHD